MEYKYLFLDADNTLLDFDQAERWGLEKTCQDVGYTYDESFLKRYGYYNDQLWQQLEQGQIDMATLKRDRFKALSEEVGILYPPEEMSKLYMTHISGADFEVVGAYELCKSLSEDYTLVVVTNGITQVQRGRFAKSRLTPFIKEIFISEEIGYAKPDPRIFEYVMDKLAINNKKEILMIGDSLSSDMKGAYMAGIDTCFYNPHHLQATLPVTYEVAHLSEVLSLLKKESSL